MSYGQYQRIVSYFEELFVAGGNLGTNLGTPNLCIWSRFLAPRFETNRFGLLAKWVLFLYFDSNRSNHAQTSSFAGIPVTTHPNISGVPKGPPIVGRLSQSFI